MNPLFTNSSIITPKKLIILREEVAVVIRVAGILVAALRVVDLGQVVVHLVAAEVAAVGDYF